MGKGNSVEKHKMKNYAPPHGGLSLTMRAKTLSTTPCTDFAAEASKWRTPFLSTAYHSMTAGDLWIVTVAFISHCSSEMLPAKVSSVMVRDSRSYVNFFLIT